MLITILAMFRKCLREHLRLVSASAFENNCGSYPPVLLITTLVSFRQRTFTQYFGPLVPLLGLFRGFPKTPNTALEGPVSALCLAVGRAQAGLLLCIACSPDMTAMKPPLAPGSRGC